MLNSALVVWNWLVVDRKQTFMAFDLRYVMFSGSAVRTVDTVAEAIAAHSAIQQAGGQTTSITGPDERIYTLTELQTILIGSPSLAAVTDAPDQSTGSTGRAAIPADQDGVASME